MNGIAFDASLALLGTLVLAIRLRWRRDAETSLKYGGIVGNLWALSIGLYYGLAESWRLGLFLWLAALSADVVLALAMWRLSRKGRLGSVAPTAL